MMTRQQHKNIKSNNKLFTIGGIVIVLLTPSDAQKDTTTIKAPDANNRTKYTK